MKIDSKISRSIVECLVICLLISCCWTSTVCGSRSGQGPRSTGRWLYVGGSGPGNYSTIQSAINASSDGDTVYVYDNSSPYTGFINITRSITLIGENQTTTVINLDHYHKAIDAFRDNTTICGFTIHADFFGIILKANNSTISRCSIHGCDIAGIYIEDYNLNHFTGNRILNTTLTDNTFGIWCDRSLLTTIENNTIAGSNESGLLLQESFDCVIKDNTIEDGNTGIDSNYGSSNTYAHNVIRRNVIGIEFFGVTYCTIKQNAFIDNNKNAHYVASPSVLLFAKIGHWDNDDYFSRHLRILGPNFWVKNFWDQPRLLPYVIHGDRYNWKDPYNAGLPVIAFDWRPALKWIP
jgi:parallel beta-helix repeat protein